MNGIPHVKSIHKTRYQILLALLLEARTAAGMTQKELAAKLGRQQSFVSKTENGERRLDVIEFMDVCRVLGADGVGMLRRVEGATAESSLLYLLTRLAAVPSHNAGVMRKKIRSYRAPLSFTAC